MQEQRHTFLLDDSTEDVEWCSSGPWHRAARDLEEIAVRESLGERERKREVENKGGERAKKERRSYYLKERDDTTMFDIQQLQRERERERERGYPKRTGSEERAIDRSA